MSVSYWLETAADGVVRPPLDASIDVDVAILGAGYTGLWTAWYLLQRDSSLRVAVVEAETAGFGASGRNGGWCSAGLGVTPGELARRFSPAVARDTVLALRQTVREVGLVCAQQGLDVDWHQGGVLRIARGPAELPSLDAAWRELEALELTGGCLGMSRRALAERVVVNRAEGALFDPHGARIHAGKLARGLARMVESAGAVIYEGTRVADIDTGIAGARPRLRTGTGDVRANTVVLAGEAWLAQLAVTRRTVMPVYSLIVLTAPLNDAQWEAIGWHGNELLSSRRYTVDYLSRTADGRVLFGGRGAPYHFGSRISPAYDRHRATHEMLRAQLADWFPVLGDVAFTHEWGGPVGMSRTWLPTIHHDPASGMAGAWGFTGQGVATANLAGRVLADSITGTWSPLAALPMVGAPLRRWEPEPLRWLAVRYLQWALARIDRRAARTGQAPSGRSLAERLARH